MVPQHRHKWVPPVPADSIIKYRRYSTYIITQAKATLLYSRGDHITITIHRTPWLRASFTFKLLAFRSLPGPQGAIYYSIPPLYQVVQDGNTLLQYNQRSIYAIMSTNITPDDTYHKRMCLVYGSITSNVAARAKSLGYITPRGTVATTRLARESGISTATLHYLFTRPETFRQLNLITLAKLCKILQAQPGDLFSYVPGLSTEALGIDVSTFSNLSGAR